MNRILLWRWCWCDKDSKRAHKKWVCVKRIIHLTTTALTTTAAEITNKRIRSSSLYVASKSMRTIKCLLSGQPNKSVYTIKRGSTWLLILPLKLGVCVFMRWWWFCRLNTLSFGSVFCSICICQGFDGVLLLRTRTHYVIGSKKLIS